MNQLTIRGALRTGAKASANWFTLTKRHLLWVPHQAPSAYIQRPAGLFGVLVSTYL